MVPGTRGKAALLFVVLLLCCTSVPVLAAEPHSEDTEVRAVFLEETKSAPDAEDIQEATEGAERREAERLAWLASPEASRQREDSRFAFTGIGASDAQRLLSDVFSLELARLDADPARQLSDAKLVGTAGDTVATIREGGNTFLLDASIPVRAENEEGDLRKVDLSLEATPEGFEPANPLVPKLIVPDSAEKPIELGDEGLSISPLGVAEREAHRLDDESIYFNSVLPDVGYLVAPISGGVEIFNALYTADSAEVLHYKLELPEGAELKPDGLGGAEIVRDKETLAYIPFPTAVDAQGTRVPVQMEIDGSTLSLQVSHRAGDYAYPILVDPAIHENYEASWYWGSDLSALTPFPGVWNYSTNDPTEAWFLKDTKCLTGDLCSPSTRGLFMFSYPKNFPANVYGHFWYWAPGATTYIPSIYPEPSAAINPFWRNNHGCSWNQYPRPFDYNGSFDVNGNWLWYETDRAQWYGNATMFTKAKGIGFGMSTGSGGWTPCYRSIMVGGVAVRLDDEDAPVMSSATVPSGWVSDLANFTATANASDGSLGVQRIRITPDGRGPFEHSLGCLGTAVNRCPNSQNVSMSLSADKFNEGERTVQFAALDPTSEPVSNTVTKTIKVDTTPPDITLSGQLAKETDEVGKEEKPAGSGDQLSLPVYNLTIKAEDGPTAPNPDPKTKRSGVKDIEVFLDGVEQLVPWEPQPCSLSSCPMTQTYKLILSKLTVAGKHTLEVVAVDQVGKKLKRTIEFEYFPATGMKDEYVMHYFPLPDGQGNEAAEEHPDRPELAVNVMNGNLVYREQDIDLEGSAVDLEIERYYNSMLPEAEDTEWGDGWTLAQTPDLDPIKAGGSPVPNEAEILDSSGAMEEGVALPTETGGQKFDPTLRATLTKKASGGYELNDETGEAATSVAFDATGQTEALVTEGLAKVDYDYEGGELSEIEVSDPATFAADSTELEIPEPQLLTAPTYASSFGSTGSGNGQFSSPADVAVDPQGNLWVVDRWNNRIEKFDSSGKFLLKFGSKGSGDGQFNRPTAIAIAPNGDLLVTDALNYRIQRFSSAGTYLSKFGSNGTGNGQFAGEGLEGIAVDQAGYVWVADTFLGRIQKFSAAGAFLQSIGSKGSGAGQLGEPTGIDIAPNGDVWVADRQNSRVSVFSFTGAFVTQFGSKGSGNGQFDYLQEIDVDKIGNVWVGDSGNNRVQQFDLTGQFKGKIGSEGSGPGQFHLGNPMGIAADSKGTLWVTDDNNRVQRWSVPIELPGYASSFGSQGTGDGQLQAPGDVAVGIEGNLWVVDKTNNRIQKFDPTGKFLAKFGAKGTGDGQFTRPTAIAVNRDGDLLVTDSTNNRVQKFSPDGQFISKFGSGGAGNGQFSDPEGITTDFDGNIWVADAYNSRIQKFDEDGKFLAKFGTAGMGVGQLAMPVGIDIDPDGNVWVSDFESNRVSIYEADGDFLTQVGSPGAGPGQFNRPSAIEIDADGNVWVADQTNGRVQRFDLDGKYVGQFGSKGTGEGQFSFGANPPAGITTDRVGRIWVTDITKHRIQQWLLGNYQAAAPVALDLNDGDPKVEVESSGDLVTSVSGSAAGTHTYVHSGDFLVSHDGPQGKTKYAKDSTGRLSKVTLANGTWASIAYFTDNRVQSVTVSVGGSESKTQFEYSDATGPEEARSTKVIPPGAPHVTYDIGADGSVFKWWHVPQPPQFLDISGSLWADKGKLLENGDHLLKIVADSPEGIASIQIIANGSTVVSEKTCAQDPEKFGIECVKEEDEWVVGTYDLAPGILNLEAIVRDRNGEVESERFWVEIPYTPPPAPGEEPRPRFKDILQFRAEHGLEAVFPVPNESELNERIFNLIGAWGNPTTPAGQVARASMERWGVPLRAEDVAELEYRDAYVPHDTATIQSWGDAQGPQQYAGYYVDHRAGGIIYVSLLGSPEQQASALASIGGLWAPTRVKVAPGSPIRTSSQLEAIRQGAMGQAIGNPQLAGDIGDVWVDVPTNKVVVSATNPALAESVLASQFGSGIAAVPGQGPMPKPAKFSRYNSEGPVQAGDYLSGNVRACTAGFGAWATNGKLKENGQAETLPLQLTAGHCFAKGEKVSRGYPDENELGKVTRNNYVEDPNQVPLDGETIKSSWPDIARSILIHDNLEKAVTGYGTPMKDQWVCVSGATTDQRACGPVLDEPKVALSTAQGGAITIRSIEILIGARVSGGDSGGPAWVMGTGTAAGLITGAHGGVYGYPDCTDLQGGHYDQGIDQNYICPVVGITTIQQIVTGAATLYNSSKLASEGVPFAEPLYIGGVTVAK